MNVPAGITVTTNEITDSARVEIEVGERRRPLVYHVVLADGAACWLVHDRLDDRWRLFGTFD